MPASTVNNFLAAGDRHAAVVLYFEKQTAVQFSDGPWRTP